MYTDASIVAFFTGREREGLFSTKKYVPLLWREHETPTLTGTKYEKPYPYWHKTQAQIHTLIGRNSQKRVP